MKVRKKNRTDPMNGSLILSLQIDQHGRWVNLARSGGKVIFASEEERDEYLTTLKNVELVGEKAGEDTKTETASSRRKKVE